MRIVCRVGTRVVVSASGKMIKEVLKINFSTEQLLVKLEIFFTDSLDRNIADMRR